MCKLLYSFPQDPERQKYAYMYLYLMQLIVQNTQQEPKKYLLREWMNKWKKHQGYWQLEQWPCGKLWADSWML